MAPAQRPLYTPWGRECSSRLWSTHPRAGPSHWSRSPVRLGSALLEQLSLPWLRARPPGHLRQPASGWCLPLPGSHQHLGEFPPEPEDSEGQGSASRRFLHPQDSEAPGGAQRQVVHPVPSRLKVGLRLLAFRPWLPYLGSAICCQTGSGEGVFGQTAAVVQSKADLYVSERVTDSSDKQKRPEKKAHKGDCFALHTPGRPPPPPSI